jgi:hypothetical protein
MAGRRISPRDQRERQSKGYTRHEVTARTGVPANRSSFAGWPSAAGNFPRSCPAGRASCAEGGRSHAFLELRVLLPLVGISFPRDQRERQPRGVYKSRSDRRPRRAPVRQDSLDSFYFAAAFSSPRYFSIGSTFGALPSHASYIFARSSVFPRDSTIFRNRSPFARVNPP